MSPRKMDRIPAEDARLRRLIDRLNRGIAVPPVVLDGTTLEYTDDGLRIRAGGVGPAQLGIIDAKGEIIVHNGTLPTALSVGTDGFALVADSTEPTGVKWAAVAAGLPLTTLGDILVYDGADDARLGVGTDGQVLTANSAAPLGISWEDPTGGGGGCCCEILVEDGSSAPPVMLTNEDEDDFLYADCGDES